MTPSPRKLLLVAGWLLSLAAAALIGGKMSQSDRRDNAPPDGSQAPRATAGNRPQAEGQAPRPIPAKKRNIDRGLAAVFEIPRGADRTRHLLELIDRLGTSEFAAFVDDFRTHPLSSTQQTDYQLILTSWVQRDPYAAAEYLDRSDSNGQAREAVIAAWAAQDPAAAELWIRDRPDEGSTNNWMVGFARGLAAEDIGKALALVESLEAGRTQGATIAVLAPYLVAAGPEAATERLEGLSEDGGLRVKATQATARAFARHQVEDAAEWARHLPDPSSQATASLSPVACFR